jgi:hypothetical protein
VRYWHPKECDQSISSVLVDFASVAIDLGAQHLEHAVHRLDPRLDIDPLRESGRALGVGDQHCRQPAVALDPGRVLVLRPL